MSPCVQFSDAGSDEALDALVRPGSEKRQGTKSREGGAPSVPRALWGLSRGVGLDEVGSKRPPQLLCLAGRVWMTAEAPGRERDRGQVRLLGVQS
jgi:hypothetical protein